MFDCVIAAGEGFSAAGFEVSGFDCGRGEMGRFFRGFRNICVNKWPENSHG
jgi:hypothetical protein